MLAILFKVTYGICFVGCHWNFLVAVGIVSDFVVMMEKGVVGCMFILYRARSLLVLCFDVVSYGFGVDDLIFLYLYHLLGGRAVCIPCS